MTLEDQIVEKYSGDCQSAKIRAHHIVGGIPARFSKSLIASLERQRVTFDVKRRQ